MIEINGYDFEELSCMKYWQPPASWSVERKKNETRARIFSNEWLGSQKRDGALYVLLKSMDGHIILRGRSKSVNGVYLDKWDHVPHLHEWGERLPNGTILLGELYLSGNEGSKNTTAIMNCLTTKAIERQKEDSKKLHYYIFDCLAWNGESWLKTRAKERFDGLSKIETNDFVEIATYVKGEELWGLLQKILADGYEGIVITHEDAFYEPDKRPSKTTMKIKQEIKETIDCVIIGANPPTREYTGKEPETWTYWFDTMTGEKIEGNLYFESTQSNRYIPITKSFFKGFAGSLKLGLYRNGNYEWFCDLSGLTEEVLMNWRDYIGKVVEIGGMMISHNQNGGVSIRHPKLLNWRKDKKPEECDWSQINA